MVLMRSIGIPSLFMIQGFMIQGNQYSYDLEVKCD
jgi:hypothetical protein